MTTIKATLLEDKDDSSRQSMQTLMSGIICKNLRSYVIGKEEWAEMIHTIMMKKSTSDSKTMKSSSRDEEARMLQ